MKRIFAIISDYFSRTASVVRNEYRSIFSDAGIILVIIIAIFVYSILYSLCYHNEVLRDVPIAVVDESRTPASRALKQTFNAGPNTYVAYDAPDMEAAKRLFFDREIYGIVLIPSDYESALLSGRQATVSLYCDASYFLMYRQVFQDIVLSLNATGTNVGYARLIAGGVNAPQAKAVSQPILYQSSNLFNPYLGYGSFIMPAIILMILQQTALIGLGMSGGTWHERGLYRRYVASGGSMNSTLPFVTGKSFAFFSIYAVSATFLFTVHYRLFGFPMNGKTIDCIAVLLPYLLACIFMGIALSTLFRRRESPLLWLIWSSIPILLLSGASLPKEGFSEWLYTLGKIFPSSSAINAYIRVQTMGASFNDVLPEIHTLWRLVLIYGGLAIVAVHIKMTMIRKAQ